MRLRGSKTLTVLISGLVVAAVALVAVGISDADAAKPVPSAWFAAKAGTATQVISVVGMGGSNAWLVPWEKRNGTWVAIGGGTGAKVGPNGISAAFKEGSRYTPAGVFSISSAFGRKVNPGTKLPYRRIDTNDWWVSDATSPRYNTYFRCVPGKCPFREAAGENLGRAGAAYDYAAVMGVNLARKPNAGSAFFLHVTNGKATAGCVAVQSGTVAGLLRWLRPGALIALKPS